MKRLHVMDSPLYDHEVDASPQILRSSSPTSSYSIESKAKSKSPVKRISAEDESLGPFAAWISNLSLRDVLEIGIALGALTSGLLLLAIQPSVAGVACLIGLILSTTLLWWINRRFPWLLVKVVTAPVIAMKHSCVACLQRLGSRRVRMIAGTPLFFMAPVLLCSTCLFFMMHLSHLRGYEEIAPFILMCVLMIETPFMGIFLSNLTQPRDKLLFLQIKRVYMPVHEIRDNYTALVCCGGTAGLFVTILLPVLCGTMRRETPSPLIALVGNTIFQLNPLMVAGAASILVFSTLTCHIGAGWLALIKDETGQSGLNVEKMVVSDLMGKKASTLQKEKI